MKLILSLVFFLTSFSCAYANDLGQAAEKSFSFKQLLKSISEPDLKNLNFSFPEAKAEENFVLRGDERYFITVLASTKEERTRLMELGLDIQEVEGNKVSGIAHAKTVTLLSQKGYVIVEKITFSGYAKEFLKDFPIADSAYHNYAEMVEVLQAITAKNSDIASLYSIGKSLEE
ncbi:MAG: hypothetical protein KAI33_05510, partial [Elusimicrobiales bacterium]|nr:hypothetical protein [Elusimicrobiales bacterium]